ncbi:SHOCT domain-containing protein [Myxococcus landrumensis]|uniref:SHOCT domain-containing protein n=1 Tax=Myxococcus landrumensis TaxID=2813577 RepID=A0ABX7MZ19_9BACT|nr:SHOCT domain-containing protein [Myxococcus landrumus]QSQ11458.1 SHOCT domain-containing protein [Myxococcus landrumus]
MDAVELTILYGSWGLFIAGGVAFMLWLAASARKTQQVREHGISAEATLLSLEPTAMLINKVRVYNSVLQVRIPGRPPYEVRLNSRTHDWNVRVLEPGLELKVKVAPDDPNRVVVMGPLIPQNMSNLTRLLQQPEGHLPTADPVKALKDLQRMASEGLITDEEFEKKKAEILARL